MALCFSAKSFLTRKIAVGTCDSKGLPMVSSSIQLLGKFHELKKIRHKHLCQYIDLIVGNKERIIIVSEHLTKSLTDFIPEKIKLQIPKVVRGILSGLEYMSSLNITHRNLQPKNILIDFEFNVKLCDYGLYFLSNFNSEVSFPVGNPLYICPEHYVFMEKSKNPIYCHPIGDIWSFGMVFFDWLTKFSILSDNRKNVLSTIKMISEFILKKENIMDFLIRKLQNKLCVLWWPPDLKSIINQALQVNPRERKSATELLKNDFLKPTTDDIENQNQIVGMWNLLPLNYENNKNIFNVDKKKCSIDYGKILVQRDLEEIYYLIKISESDILTRLKSTKFFSRRPQITCLPKIISNQGELFGLEKDESFFYIDDFVIIPLNEITKKLSEYDIEIHYPLLSVVENPSIIVQNSYQPIAIKERNMSYQLYRMNLFRGLLNSYPYSIDRIIEESKLDVPPVFRGKVWAALLNVKGDYKKVYQKIDKTSISSADKQIDVDLPRCHQYNYLMSSFYIREKLKRIIKAWLRYNSNLVYWQGLDSLAAPFLLQNLDDEALAFFSFHKFIEKYCFNFFLKDNSYVMNEYLAVFSQLFAFHDPVLNLHLHNMGFFPDLYAIPWFLTMFSHVLPLHSIYHLWDTLILGSSLFPMCFGVSILMITRNDFIDKDFNQCIMNFANLSEIDINLCLSYAINIYHHTPPSIAFHLPNESKFKKADDTVNDAYSHLPDRKPMTLIELKNDFCPRVSCKDIFRILHTQQIPINSQSFLPEKYPIINSLKEKDSLTNEQKIQNKQIVFVDVRPENEFNVSRLRDSINIPVTNFQNINIESFQQLKNYSGWLKVICSNTPRDATIVGNVLVRNGYKYVCALDIEIPRLSEYKLLIKQ